ncbi:fertility inhibition FinO-like protein [Leptolyngbya sp. FACHB-261]|nr:fertility inhibition FinO-like protein [Leptolyngbya sp. FACHB-261]
MKEPGPPVSGKLEVTIKINQFPDEIKTVDNGWKQFLVDVGVKEVRITVRPKVFKKIEDAQANYPQWVAVITGQMGSPIPKGFILEQPNIQVFERKPKEATSEDSEL